MTPASTEPRCSMLMIPVVRIAPIKTKQIAMIA